LSRRFRIDANELSQSFCSTDWFSSAAPTNSRKASAPASENLEEVVQKVQMRAGQLVAAEFNGRIAALRSALLRDIMFAGGKANEISGQLP
jgi:hypothetical protein